MLRTWDVLKEELVLDGAPWLRVWVETVRLPSGRTLHPFYRYQKPDHVSIFALDAEGRALVQRRYRHGPRVVTLDVPAGYLEPGEAPQATAARELLEETGFEAAAWTPLGVAQTDGNGGGSRCHTFLARGARRVAEPHEDETEAGELLALPLDEVRRALEAGGFATLTACATVARGLLTLGV